MMGTRFNISVVEGQYIPVAAKGTRLSPKPLLDVWRIYYPKGQVSIYDVISYFGCRIPT